MMQLGQPAVNTHACARAPTLKHDRHFLLVDDEVGLEEDAENDPGDLRRRKKQREESVRRVAVKPSGPVETRQQRRASAGDGRLEPRPVTITVQTTWGGPPTPGSLRHLFGTITALQHIASE